MAFLHRGMSNCAICRLHLVLVEQFTPKIDIAAAG